MMSENQGNRAACGGTSVDVRLPSMTDRIVHDMGVNFLSWVACVHLDKVTGDGSSASHYSGRRRDHAAPVAGGLSDSTEFPRQRCPGGNGIAKDGRARASGRRANRHRITG